MNIIRAEGIVFAIGLGLLTIWGVAHIHGTLASRKAIARFQAEEAGMSSMADPILGSKVDFTLWATNRVAAYETSLIQKKDQPLAISGPKCRSEEHTSELQSLRHLVCR